MSRAWADVEMPTYQQMILPTIRAVAALGGSAQTREITPRVLEEMQPSDELLAVAYPNRPDDSVFLERMNWARSSSKLIGALESPNRGVFLITALGRKLLTTPIEEAEPRVARLDREMRASRKRERQRAIGSTTNLGSPDDGDPREDLDETGDLGEAEAPDWRSALLTRLHALHPDAFEEFVLYLLREYGLTLERIGGTGDEGVDGIGTAPISAVLSSRVAVQVKRYDPNGKSIGRETVALFQRDAQTKGAERAILVTLGRFSEPARKAANATIPTVDLIDGEKLTDLMLEKKVGVQTAPVANTKWFDRFDVSSIPKS